MAQEMNIPFSGKIPLDPDIIEAGQLRKTFRSVLFRNSKNHGKHSSTDNRI